MSGFRVDFVYAGQKGLYRVGCLTTVYSVFFWSSRVHYGMAYALYRNLCWIQTWVGSLVWRAVLSRFIRSVSDFGLGLKFFSGVLFWV